MTARVVTVLAAISHPGQSLLTAALCCIFALHSLQGRTLQIAAYVAQLGGL